MKDTSGDITQTEEFIRRNADVGFKVFGGKDTLLYASLCIGAVGGVCTAGNFMPEPIVDIYNKYVAGDIQGSLAAQYKLNPVRLAMDGASFPVAAKDMAIMRGLAAGKPYLPNLPTPEGASYDKMKKEMEKSRSRSNMKHTVTLRNGVQVPALGLGTWFLGENKSAREREQESLACRCCSRHDADRYSGNVWKWKSGKSYKRGHF